MMKIQSKHLLLLIVAFMALLGLLLTPTTTLAMGLADDPTPEAPIDNNPHREGDCLGCHSLPNIKGRTVNGEIVSLSIQPGDSNMNFHTQAGIGCKFCHLDQGEYPHANSTFATCAVCHTMNGQPVDQTAELIFSLPFNDAREFTLSFNTSCSQCHQEKAEQVKASVHTRLLNEGNVYAPICVDCHGSHNIGDASRQNQSEICKKCHADEYNQYKDSVHGAALQKEGNPDVPTCGGCHGSHAVKGPSNTDFRQIAATEICGKCHSDPAVMDKYGISTDVLGTYMDDVHGKTNLMGRVNRLDEVKATCYDCHGVHNILSPSNPYSSVYPANLQNTCAQCHENAGISFPAAWLSHKRPDLQSMPLLYLINNYSLGVVIAAGLLIFAWIILDLRRSNAVQMQKNERGQG